VNTTRAAEGAANQAWSVGELAKATSLTVRTLHHYDDVGLLTPSVRNHAGHRRYTAADKRRLHHILALRGFGLSLAEIAGVLDGTENDPGDLLRRRLVQIEERIALASRLRTSLLGLLDALEGTPEPTAAKLVELIEVMISMERSLSREELERMNEARRAMAERLSPEELDEMTRRRQRMREQLSPEQLAEMERRRAALLADIPDFPG
jgi:MerR family transcriptional regulator, thiopeptide resistance regulator